MRYDKSERKLPPLLCHNAWLTNRSNLTEPTLGIDLTGRSVFPYTQIVMDVASATDHAVALVNHPAWRQSLPLSVLEWLRATYGPRDGCLQRLYATVSDPRFFGCSGCTPQHALLRCVGEMQVEGKVAPNSKLCYYTYNAIGSDFTIVKISLGRPGGTLRVEQEIVAATDLEGARERLSVAGYGPVPLASDVYRVGVLVFFFFFTFGSLKFIFFSLGNAIQLWRTLESALR